jgi:hypothetical protein
MHNLHAIYQVSKQAATANFEYGVELLGFHAGQVLDFHEA